MNKTVHVFINGIEYDIDKKETLSFEEVVKLAFGTYENSDRVAYTVTYSRAHGNKKGILVKGQEVKIKEGMIFNATCTNKS